MQGFEAKARLQGKSLAQDIRESKAECASQTDAQVVGIASKEERVKRRDWDIVHTGSVCVMSTSSWIKRLHFVRFFFFCICIYFLEERSTQWDVVWYLDSPVVPHV